MEKEWCVSEGWGIERYVIIMMDVMILTLRMIIANNGERIRLKVFDKATSEKKNRTRSTVVKVNSLHTAHQHWDT